MKPVELQGSNLQRTVICVYVFEIKLFTITHWVPSLSERLEASFDSPNHLAQMSLSMAAHPNARGQFSAGAYYIHNTS